MNRFTFLDLPLFGLKLVKRKQIGDDRGFLARLFCREELALIGWTKPIAQINHTFSPKQGTVRGMHFQRGAHAEMKIVSCIRGEVWDVAVDMRKGSETFLQWHAEYLSNKNGYAMLIPEGFAHGFQALSDDVELIYFHSEPHFVDAEDGLNPRDPSLNINWPLKISEISSKDAGRPLIIPGFKGVEI